MIGTRLRTPSGPAVNAPRTKAGYMTAPDPLAEAPKMSLPRGGRPYMTFEALISARVLSPDFSQFPRALARLLRGRSQRRYCTPDNQNRECTNLEITNAPTGACHRPAVQISKGGFLMDTKVWIVALAFTIVGGLGIAPLISTAVAEGVNHQSAAGSTSAPAMRMDRCPYYPSPVACHDHPILRIAASQDA
jgi:hypothetical protein